MAVPSQVAPSPRKRCRNCGRFVARGAELCARCSGLVSLDDVRARLGLVETDTLLLPAIRPRPEAPASPSTPAVAPALRVVRAGRTRCAGCGRFVADSRTYCDRCEATAETPNQPVAMAASRSTSALPPPELRTEALQESWVYQRSRDEFVIPRPSELHFPGSVPDSTPAEARIDVSPTTLNRRRVGIDVLRRSRRTSRSQATPIAGDERAGAWRDALMAAAARQWVPLIVVAGAAMAGTAVALFFVTR